MIERTNKRKGGKGREETRERRNEKAGSEILGVCIDASRSVYRRLSRELFSLSLSPPFLPLSLYSTPSLSLTFFEDFARGRVREKERDIEEEENGEEPKMRYESGEAA